jgi:hypothetical protein
MRASVTTGYEDTLKSSVRANSRHGSDAEVLLPWDQDEFAAALKLRADLAVWRAAHAGEQVELDGHLWAAGS